MKMKRDQLPANRKHEEDPSPLTSFSSNNSPHNKAQPVVKLPARVSVIKSNMKLLNLTNPPTGKLPSSYSLPTFQPAGNTPNILPDHHPSTQYYNEMDRSSFKFNCENGGSRFRLRTSLKHQLKYVLIV